jgi:phage terminase large subunit-like protein
VNKTALTDADVANLRGMTLVECITAWDLLEKDALKKGDLVAVRRTLILADLFYLLVRVCGRVDMVHPWVYARCREVESNPDGYIDLWAREHFKSSIITFGLTIWDILKDPDVTIGFFSHTRPIAKAFLRQIMRELEGNTMLHECFPDVLWGRDTKQAPKWSEDDGIIVKRVGNPNEATIEAWGVVDGQPTSKHFAVLHYDDLVTEKSVTTPEMIEKTSDSFALSLNLGKRGGKKRIAGTFYHFGDTYKWIIKSELAKARIYPATDDGTENGNPVLLTREQLSEKRKQGPYIFSCQQLLSPAGDKTQGFKRDWLRKYRNMKHVDKMNGYILVDAASSKKRGSDYTSMWVVGLNTDGNRYCLDIVRDRLNLKERGDRLFGLHRKWSDLGLKIQQVRYERYGLMSDIEHYESRMEDENYRFRITEVGGQTSKTDRIKRLIPLFEQGRIWIPESLNVTDWQGKVRDLVNDFIEDEFCAFPVGIHDDMLDALARMEEPDLKLVWPQVENPKDNKPVFRNFAPATAWMA